MNVFANELRTPTLVVEPVAGEPVPGDPAGGFRSLAAATGRTADEVAEIAAAGGLAGLIAEINSGGAGPDDTLAEKLVKGEFQERSEISEVSRVALSGYRSLADASGRNLLEVVEAAQAGQLQVGGAAGDGAQGRQPRFHGGAAWPAGVSVAGVDAVAGEVAGGERAAGARGHTARQRQLEIRRRRAAWVWAA